MTTDVFIQKYNELFGLKQENEEQSRRSDITLLQYCHKDFGPFYTISSN